MNKSVIKTYLTSLYSYLETNNINEVAKCCDYLKLPKGTKLIQEGKRHPFFYIINRGCVKSYYQNEEKQICSWFAFENEVISTMKSFDGQPSNETIKLLEDSELIRFHTKSVKTLAESNISVARLINKFIIEHTEFLEELLYIKSKPSKERYDYFIIAEPQLLQRVSLTDLASFLGISRETLSRIRNKK
jgi:CRP-like cAMP-binding protein